MRFASEEGWGAVCGTGYEIDTRIDAISLVKWVSGMNYRVWDMGQCVENLRCGMR